MKYLKHFESTSRRDIEINIAGLLVELFDIGVDIDIKWLDSISFEILLKVSSRIKTDDIVFIIKGFEDYMENIWDNPHISYVADDVRLQRIPYGYNINDYVRIYVKKKY